MRRSSSPHGTDKTARPRGSPAGSGPLEEGSTTTAGGEGRGELIQRGLGGGVAAGAVGHHGEGEQPSIDRQHGAGEGVHAEQGSGLRADGARSGPGVAPVEQGPVVAGHGKAGEDRGGARE